MEWIRMSLFAVILALPTLAHAADAGKVEKKHKEEKAEKAGKGDTVDKSSGTPQIITRPLQPNTGEYAKTPCYRSVRYCTEWLPDKKCKLWDVKQEEVSCN